MHTQPGGSPVLTEQRLELLRHAALSFGASLDLAEVLSEVLREAQAVLAAGSWAVWLLESDGSILTCWRASAPRSDGLEGYQVTVDRGILGQAVRDGMVIYSPDLHSDPRYDREIGAHAEIPPAALICCPLVVGSRETETYATIGAVSVVSDRVCAFKPEDVAVVCALTASAATAIHNARLYDQAQQELTRRRQVEDALRQRQDRKSVV